MKKYSGMRFTKKILSFFLFICFVTTIQAQKGEIGFTFSGFSNNAIARFGDSYEDDSSTDAGKSFAFGITYIKPLNNWLELESGIEILQCPAEVHSIFYDQNGFTSYNSKGLMSIINIPISVRANFWKYCFVNGGFVLDVDISKYSPVNQQTGLGTMLGVGLKYDLKSGISFFLNPYIKIHTFPASFQTNQQHLLESAFRFGITYNL